MLEFLGWGLIFSLGWVVFLATWLPVVAFVDWDLKGVTKFVIKNYASLLRMCVAMGLLFSFMKALLDWIML